MKWNKCQTRLFVIIGLLGLMVIIDCTTNEFNLTIVEEIDVNTEIYNLNNKDLRRAIMTLNGYDDEGIDGIDGILSDNIALTNLSFSFLDSTRITNAYFQIDNRNMTVSIQKRIDRDFICENRLLKTCTCSSACNLKVDILVNGLISPDMVPFYHIFTLNIQVIDINDNRPKFLFGEYLIEIPENVPQSYHRIPLPVAFDHDSGMNSIQTYFLSNLSDLTHIPADDNRKSMSQLFSVDFLTSKNIYLKVNTHLDYEKTSEYIMYLYAFDGGRPPYFDQTKLLIKIIDQNDNNPIFDVNSFRLNLSESTSIGTELLTVRAKDLDAGTNSIIEYSFVESQFNGNMNGTDLAYMNYFDLNRSSGKLVLTRVLDYEKTKYFRLVIVASDKGSPSLHSTIPCTVDVHVFDENDNAPVISIIKTYDQNQIDKATLTANNNSILVNEAAQLNSFVCLITASDLDSSAFNIDFDILPNDRNLKVLELKNGSRRNENGRIFALVVNGKLNREHTNKYQIRINATDSGRLKSELVLNVVVEDSNDNAPVCTKPNGQLKFTINENNALNQLIGCMNCTDNDELENARLDYFLVGRSNNWHVQFDDAIRLDRTSGCLYAAKNFDREKQSTYKFDIDVRDNGVPKLTTRVQLSLVVNDLNDNVPYFTKPFYNFTVEENQQTDVEVGRVYAHDSDSNEYSKITYSLMSLNGIDSDGPFRIDPQSGSIYISPNHTIDADGAGTPSQYRYIVHANDNGQPSFGATCLVYIDILDVNDNCPKFKIEYSSYIEHTREAEDRNDLASAFFYLNTNQIFPSTRVDGQVLIGKLYIYDMDRDQANNQVTITDKTILFYDRPTNENTEPNWTLDVTMDDLFNLTHNGYLYAKYSKIGSNARRGGYYRIQFDLKDNGEPANTRCFVQNKTLLISLDNSTGVPNGENIRTGIKLLNMLYEIDERKNKILSASSILTSNQRLLVTYISLSLLIVVIVLLLVFTLYFVIFKRKTMFSSAIVKSQSKNKGNIDQKGQCLTSPRTINRQEERVGLTQNYEQVTNLLSQNNDYLLRPKMMNGSFESTICSTSSSSCTPVTTSTITSASNNKKAIRSVLV